MEKDLDKIHPLDYCIINIPAFLFLLFIPAGVAIYLSANSQFRLLVIPFTIWGISGCILLLHDYYVRKKNLYFRLLRLNKNRDPLKHSLYLKSTFCGLSILWALHVRNINSIRRESL